MNIDKKVQLLTLIAGVALKIESTTTFLKEFLNFGEEGMAKNLDSWKAAFSSE